MSCAYKPPRCRDQPRTLVDDVFEDELEPFPWLSTLKMSQDLENQLSLMLDRSRLML